MNDVNVSNTERRRLSQYRREILENIGITLWQSRSELQSDSVFPNPVESKISWKQVELEASTCTRCPLHQQRNRVVFGKGSRHAGTLIVGEAPGAEEDRQGIPFVGKAGLLLDEMLGACEVNKDDVYIANIVKCRPPNNRNPGKSEIDFCLQFLLRQIELLSPRVILVLGRIAAHVLLGTDQPLARLRGRVHYDNIADVPIVVTYHPAYLLRSPLEKVKSWSDLCLFKSMVEKTRK